MPNPVAGGRSSAALKQEILAKVPFIDEASPELRNALAENAVVVRLRAGEYFLREGDSCAHFAVVASGRMRVFKLGENGHEITLYHVGPGEACPLNVSCILSETTVPAMACVEDDVEAIVVPAATFRRWIAEHESLRSFVFRMFAGRLTEVMSLVEEVAFRRMDQRLAGRLAELFESDGSDGSVEITHAELAANLGTAREVVSRLLKEFERLGAIRLQRGKIFVRNSALLRTLAERGEA
jgi:CRP/FNR family transcriptional regulator, anaerobic regulatory protein